MKILHVAAGLSSSARPYHQPFIKSQIDSLIREGIDCGIYEIKSFDSKIEYFKSIPIIRSILTNEKYDLIHCHYSYCGFSSYLASNNTPIVLSLMGSDLLGTPTFDGKLSIRGRIDKLIANGIVGRMDHIIVKSNSMKNLLKCKVPISVIPNGINLSVFKPLDLKQARENLGLNAQDFLVLFLGNKNQPVKNFKLANESVELFKRIVKSDNIKMLNPFGISQETVVEYMNASNVLLFTSHWEGSPNVIKEAMACNLPIISTDVGDVKDVIADALNCFIVKHSKEDIAEKLRRIYEDRYKSNGRGKIVHLSSDVIANKIIEVYKATIVSQKSKFVSNEK